MNSSQCKYRLTFVPLLLLLAANGQAATLLYEPFDYPAGTNLDGLAATGLNLFGNYATSTIQDLAISSPGLDYGSLQGNLPSVAGNRLGDVNGVGAGLTTIAVANDIAIEPGKEVFFSALMTFNDATGGNRFTRISFVDDTSGDEISFGEASVGVRAIRVTADTMATQGLIAEGADNSFTNGQTLLLVGHYLNSAAASSDALELLGYDTAATHSLPLTFDLTDPNAQFAYSLSGVDIDFSQITSLRFEIRGDQNNFLDELRIGPTYESIAQVPEPAGYALLACFLVASVGTRSGRPERVERAPA
jgi:hypothetical protein